MSRRRSCLSMSTTCCPSDAWVVSRIDAKRRRFLREMYNVNPADDGIFPPHKLSVIHHQSSSNQAQSAHKYSEGTYQITTQPIHLSTANSDRPLRSIHLLPRMGSSASKSARRLPTSTQSSLPKLPTQPPPSRPSPSTTSHGPGAEHAELDETYSRTRDLRGNAPRFQQSAAPGGGSGAGARAAGSPAGQGRSAGLDYGLADQGAMPGSTGRARGGFSGEKDDGAYLSAFLPRVGANVIGQCQQ